ncbi:MAG: adenylyltransferase/cytidyltransferase family protein [Candidatus Methanodesulfokora sp.]|jgi:FAD synthetase|nr:MAG: FAD synthase [Candidatus Korarchaeota archaeon]
MGRKVLTAGTFDIIHPGHVALLIEAKKIAGNEGELVVIIARDSNILKFKGRKPILKENERLFVVRNLKPVDKAVLGDENDILRPIVEEKPDIIVLGYDQWAEEEWLREELRKRGINAEIIRLGKFYSENDSTTDVINRIIKLFCQGDQQTGGG